MFPSFVKEVQSDYPFGIRTLQICGRNFTVCPWDTFITDAIMLANRWPQQEVSYERILYLRTWIKENVIHGHNIPYLHLYDLQGCRYFIESVIHSAHKRSGQRYTIEIAEYVEEIVRSFKCRHD